MAPCTLLAHNCPLRRCIGDRVWSRCLRCRSPAGRSHETAGQSAQRLQAHCHGILNYCRQALTVSTAQGIPCRRHLRSGPPCHQTGCRHRCHWGRCRTFGSTAATGWPHPYSGAGCNQHYFGSRSTRVNLGEQPLLGRLRPLPLLPSSTAAAPPPPPYQHCANMSS